MRSHRFMFLLILLTPPFFLLVFVFVFVFFFPALYNTVKHCSNSAAVVEGVSPAPIRGKNYFDCCFQHCLSNAGGLQMDVDFPGTIWARCHKRTVISLAWATFNESSSFAVRNSFYSKWLRSDGTHPGCAPVHGAFDLSLTQPHHLTLIWFMTLGLQQTCQDKCWNKSKNKNVKIKNKKGKTRNITNSNQQLAISNEQQTDNERPTTAALPTRSIQQQTSNNKRSTSIIQQQTSNIKHATANVQPAKKKEPRTNKRTATKKQQTTNNSCE